MLRRLFQLVFFVFVICLSERVQAAAFEVRNIAVSVQSESAVMARDMALSKAQRVAFAALVGMTENDLPHIDDAQIARLVRGFSLQGERLAARSYAANFTIRFNPATTRNFILQQQLQLTPQAASGQAISVNRTITDKPAAPDGQSAEEGSPESAAALDPVALAAAQREQTIVILPVLDIGSRRVIWDEPGLWRNVWQKQDHSTPGLTVRVALGDVDDIADIPDAGFLNSGPANIARLLERYEAGNLYIVVAKNQGAALNTAGGMALSLYRHNGQQLTFQQKRVIRPRPGYMFDDAVPAAMTMIASAHTGRGSLRPAAAAETLADVAAEQAGNPAATVDPSVLEPTIPAATEQVPSRVSGPILVVVPYQSLQQWIGIQRRLRMVPGMKGVVPLRVSPSSAQVSLTTTLSSSTDLERNLALQNFRLQKMPNGEIALIDQ